jgi:hypothetical protein
LRGGLMAVEQKDAGEQNQEADGTFELEFHDVAVSFPCKWFRL